VTGSPGFVKIMDAAKSAADIAPATAILDTNTPKEVEDSTLKKKNIESKAENTWTLQEDTSIDNCFQRLRL
jgi:hypothetical protein